MLAYGGHKDSELYQIPEKEIEVKISPKGSTSIVQPLDLYCFGLWKDFAQRLSEQAFLFNFRIDGQHSVPEMQSLIFNQFQHPSF